VIIPAHNEASTLARCLAAMSREPAAKGEAPSARLDEVIVVCNACTDGTADTARAAATPVTVIETPEAGKAKAINIGLDRARPGPVIVLDADVEIGSQALAALAYAVAGDGIMAAAPAAELDLTDADPWVKDYYAVFGAHEYLSVGVGGSGVYALSRDARRSVAPFPDIISDDGYLRHRLAPEQQIRLGVDADGNPVRARVRPPRRLTDLLRTETRWRQGDAQVRRLLGHSGPRRPLRAIRHLVELRVSRRVRTGELARYILIKLIGRSLRLVDSLSGRAGTWHRDSSSRGEFGVRL